MNKELFPGAPVITALSERSDGEMGSSKNPGEDGKFLKNRATFLAKFGINAEDQLVLGGQVHGSNIQFFTELPEKSEVTDSEGKSFLVRRFENTDGFVTPNPRAVLGIFGSDCFPVFFYYPVPANNSPLGIIGLVHGGRRGAMRGIVSRGVEKMFTSGAEQRDKILAAIGPGICKECHWLHTQRDKTELSELAKSYPESLAKVGEDADGERIGVDLKGIIIKQLINSGISKDRINDIDESTCSPENVDRWISHRRDRTGKNSGNNVLYAACLKQP